MNANVTEKTNLYYSSDFGTTVAQTCSTNVTERGCNDRNQLHNRSSQPAQLYLLVRTTVCAHGSSHPSPHRICSTNFPTVFSTCIENLKPFRLLFFLKELAIENLKLSDTVEKTEVLYSLLAHASAKEPASTHPVHLPYHRQMCSLF